jgi:RNA polymerase sigma factor (sigma-70 family)
VSAQAQTRDCATSGASTSPSREEQTVAVFLDEPSEVTFPLVFRLYAPRLIRYFRLRSCSLAVAEELAQDVMLAVYRQAAALRDRRYFRAWVYQIAHNTLRHFWRKKSREVETVDIVLAADAVDRSGNPLDASILRQSLSTISEDDREMFYLRWVDGLEHHEIATLLKLPIGTVQWRIFQIRKKLAAIVK